MKVLLTNDDGIEAEGLQALRAALAALDDVELVTIAPDGNRSAFARKITTHKPLWMTAALATQRRGRRSTACASPRSAWSKVFIPS
ncbi:MAG: hypothetical protein JHD03_02620 [Solirubrobacteraceae bacterium]|nr:hypothetical protein [Solirubrobacteraceae bacterium]